MSAAPVAPGGDVIVVAGGLGLAPVRSVVYGILARRRRHGRVTVVAGARTPADLLYYTEEYAAWRTFDIDVRTTVDRAGAEHTTAYLCGPEVMMTAAAEALTARGLPDKRIVLSLDRSMKCGVGTCGHCRLGPDLIRRDGPCVTYAHAAPLLAVKEL